jgi:hypothetical protein
VVADGGGCGGGVTTPPPLSLPQESEMNSRREPTIFNFVTIRRNLLTIPITKMRSYQDQYMIKGAETIPAPS